MADKEFITGKIRPADLYRLLMVIFFSIAMGYLESAVVVYLREIYYPEGFAFPLKVMDSGILITEIGREFATLVMLGGIGIIAGRSALERFGMFILAFGTWDIFYYVFLYVLLGWPESLFTWDILFLIPTTWVGPVLAPCINAFSMIIFGALIWHFQSAGKLQPVKSMSWLLLALGSLIVVWAYIQDYVKFLRQEFSFKEIFFPSDSAKLMESALQYVPVEFSWWIFWVGQVMIIAGIGTWFVSHKGTQRVSQRTQRKSKNHNR
jgi:hypothetical protein